MNNCEHKDCQVFKALQLVGGKWVLIILAQLIDGKKRFGELKKAIPGISPKMLTQQLRKLEEEGLIQRTIYAQVPPKVEYALTDKGRALGPVYHRIVDWGNKYYPQPPG